MAQLTQMTRYVSSWLGWTPEAASFDCCLSANEDALLQESSGFVTVMALYLAMTVVLAAVSFCTSGKASDAARLREKRELAQQRPWRHTAPGMAMAKLIRQLGTPKHSRHQRQRLRIKLRRHLEQELKLVRELQEKGQMLGLLDWQDVEDVEESTYFDLPSETE